MTFDFAKLLGMAAVLSACSFDQSGLSPGGSVDAGQVDAVADDPADAAAGAPDALVTDARIDAPADSDGDGRPDGADNCPRLANADQRDHEADGRGDACDSCPHVADAVFADDDGDGIGDACDPRPGSGDALVEFNGFYDDRDGPPPGWTAVGTASPWRIRGGRLEQTSAQRGIQVLYRNQLLGIQDIETSVRVDTVAPVVANTTNTRTVGVVVGYQPSSTATWLCALRADITDPQRATVLALYNLTTTTIVSQVLSPELADKLVAGTEAQIAAGIDDLFGPGGPATLAGCAVRDAGSPDLLTDDVTGAAGGYPGIRTNGVKASFDFVVVYAAATP